MDIETIIEEIDFAKQDVFGMHIGSCELAVAVIPINVLYTVLINNIPEFKTYFNGETTRINTPELASLPTTSI